MRRLAANDHGCARPPKHDRWKHDPDRLGRPFVKLDTFAMVNLIAGQRIVPELIQDAFTPEAVADEAVSMLTDAARAGRIREGLSRVARAALSAAGRAASG